MGPYPHAHKSDDANETILLARCRYFNKKIIHSFRSAPIPQFYCAEDKVLERMTRFKSRNRQQSAEENPLSQGAKTTAPPEDAPSAERQLGHTRAGSAYQYDTAYEVPDGDSPDAPTDVTDASTAPGGAGTTGGTAAAAVEGATRGTDGTAAGAGGTDAGATSTAARMDVARNPAIGSTAGVDEVIPGGIQKVVEKVALAPAPPGTAGDAAVSGNVQGVERDPAIGSAPGTDDMIPDEASEEGIRATRSPSATSSGVTASGQDEMPPPDGINTTLVEKVASTNAPPGTAGDDAGAGNVPGNSGDLQPRDGNSPPAMPPSSLPLSPQQDGMETRLKGDSRNNHPGQTNCCPNSLPPPPKLIK